MSTYINRQMLNPAPGGLTDKADGLFQRSLAGIARNWRRRKMTAALAAMDDRLLRDIGIYREDIRRVVDGFDDRELRMIPVAPSASGMGHDARQYQQAA